MNTEQAGLKVGDIVMQTVPDEEVDRDNLGGGQQYPAKIVEADRHEKGAMLLEAIVPCEYNKYRSLIVASKFLRLATPAEIQQAHKGGEEG